jgi:ubiquinone/menaquinone biosynthesis C-methylase UbiE
MTSLIHEGSSLAYRVQQRLLVTACGLTQRLARRTLLEEREAFSRGELTALRRRYDDLLTQDLANVEAGVYPRSLLFALPWATYVRRLPQLFWDVPSIIQRKKQGDWRDLPDAVDLAEYPKYYRRTFHWQTDGYLSKRSAELYDVGVEFLFGGTADIMRRQSIVPLRALQSEQRTPLRVLDLGCGTGRTLAQIHRALPDAKLTGVDLSPFYLESARAEVGSSALLLTGNAESLDLPSQSFDAVVSVFMFHELPKNARRKVWAEALRVLRPGGRFIIVDSVQRSDSEEIAYFVDRFSRDMHEPFYREYGKDDLATGLRESGFLVESVTQAYLAKVVTARAPQAASADVTAA